MHAPGSTLDAAHAASLFPLVSGGSDLRTFRRFPISQEAGVQLSAHSAPHRSAPLAMHESSSAGLSYRSVIACNLSLTGLYFLTALPYRVDCWLEIQLPLARQTLHLPAVVRRLERSARVGGHSQAFGCGVDFLYSRMSTESKQALMQFLMERFSPEAVLPNKKRAATDPWPGPRPL